MRAKPTPGLYLVATPIGNARDISLRALDILADADLIACEDTRVTGKLLSMHGLNRPLMAYHDHNGARVRPELLQKLTGGAVVALVSDAGTPMISDPGYKLVAEAVAQGVAVTSVPGASALITGLQLSALPTDRFLFGGFLDQKQAARRAALAELKGVPATLVFYESGKRIPASIADMADILGDRPAAVARELTKLYEEVRRGTLSELAAHYAKAGAPLGEVVVIVGRPLDAPADAAALDQALIQALGHSSVRDAAETVAKATGLPRRAVYARALELAKDAKGEDED